jgi:DNA-binding NarL/FixJ family response regulator
MPSSSKPQRAAIPSPSVCVVADDEVARRRVCSILRHGRLAVAAHAAAVEELESALGARAMDAVIIAAGKDEALRDAVGSVRSRWPQVRIVGILDDLNWRGARELLGAGVEGLVLSATMDASLVLGVQGALSGQLSLPAELREHLARPRFSAREKQILGMVVMGFTNGEVATKLFISESTVKSHLAAAFIKLGVRSRSEASALILDPKNGLGTGILEISSAAERSA